MTRISKDEYFIRFARVAALRGTCDRLRVGAVLTSADGVLLCSGYNGSPRNEPHCDDIGHLMEDGHCVRTVHAELNAIVQSAKHGINIDGATLYVTHMPCRDCLNHLINAGIRRIVYGDDYRKWEGFKEKCERQGIVSLQIKEEAPQVNDEDFLSRCVRCGDSFDIRDTVQCALCPLCFSKNWEEKEARHQERKKEREKLKTIED